MSQPIVRGLLRGYTGSLIDNQYAARGLTDSHVPRSGFVAGISCCQMLLGTLNVLGLLAIFPMGGRVFLPSQLVRIFNNYLVYTDIPHIFP